MSQKQLSKWLKGMILLAGACGAAVYCAVIPMLGCGIVGANPEMENRFLPWLIFLWTTAVPCAMALVIGWRIAARIGRDEAFTTQNAGGLRQVAVLAAGDAGWFFVGNLLLLFCNLSHPGVTLASTLVTAAGIVVAVAAACLSRLVQRAAVLQEQSDLTI